MGKNKNGGDSNGAGKVKIKVLYFITPAGCANL